MDDQYLQLVKSQEINQEYNKVKAEFQAKLKYGLDLEGISKIAKEKEDLQAELNHIKNVMIDK